MLIPIRANPASLFKAPITPTLPTNYFDSVVVGAVATPTSLEFHTNTDTGTAVAKATVSAIEQHVIFAPLPVGFLSNRWRVFNNDNRLVGLSNQRWRVIAIK